MAHRAHRPLAVRLLAAVGCRRRHDLRALYRDFGQAEIDWLAEKEAVTRHDVKAVEYLVRDRLSTLGLDAIAELTHFACTSEDINSASYALTVQRAVDARSGCRSCAPSSPRSAASPSQHRDAAMLSRTHGQPATPTTMGKELAVFVWRLERVAGADRGLRVPRQVLRSDRHLVGAPRRRSRRRLAGAVALVHRGARPRLQPADDPDRVARLAGRAVRPGAPCRRHPAQSRHRHLDLHLARLLRADPRRGRHRVVDDAAQDQPDPVRERRGEPRDLGRPARRRSPRRS